MDAQLYNLSYLQEVFQGNDAMVCRILDLFEAQVPGYFEEMECRLAKGQWKELHPLAHKAKSSLGMLGMSEVLQHILCVEAISRKGQAMDDIEVQIKAAKAALNLAMAALAADRGSLHLTEGSRKEPRARDGSPPAKGRGLKRA